MKYATTTRILKAGAIAAGASMVIATPSFAQRYRGDDRSNSDNSRPVQHSEPRQESRPAPRESAPIYRAPEPSRSMPSPSAPRWTPSPSPTPAPAPRWTPAPRPDPIRTPERNIPVDNGTGWRNRSDRVPDNGGIRPSPRATDPVYRNPRDAPIDTQPRPRIAPLPRDTGGIKPTNPRRTPDPIYKPSPNGLPEGNRPGGGPGWRPGADGSSDTGKLTPRPTENPRMGRRAGPVSPGATSPVGWKPPSKTGSLGGRSGGSVGARDVPGRSPGDYRPGGVIHNVPVNNYRPPHVDRNRWRDGGRSYGGRHFYTVDLGWYDPWYCYNWSIFSGVRFYYPFYYCGPYISTVYYSPFWCYGGWAPMYIYPERIIYVERRVYLRDVADDDYDLYASYAQSSMRDTMDDIRTAWLDGDGGRLLDHINQAIPVRIYQKGVYKYSLEPDDFRDVTKDALNRVQTVSFEWTKVDRVADDEVRLEARHVFTDPDGQRHAIRLNYTLEKARGSWWITETGTEKWTDDI